MRVVTADVETHIQGLKLSNVFKASQFFRGRGAMCRPRGFMSVSSIGVVRASGFTLVTLTPEQPSYMNTIGCSKHGLGRPA